MPRKKSTYAGPVICALCGKREKNKQALVEHIRTCEISRTCTWCDIIFKNRGNLFSHTLHIHGKKTGKMSEIRRASRSSYECNVCDKSYTQITNLKYHIRRDHYNLMARITLNEHRELNEVWLERVLNTDELVEIRKAKGNMYLMRRVKANDKLHVSEPIDSIDLSPLYPTHIRKARVWCDLCNKSCYQRDFQKHINEKHAKITRHECNNCNRRFKRPYLYLKHICSHKKKKHWGPAEENQTDQFVNQCDDQITIIE